MGTATVTIRHLLTEIRSADRAVIGPFKGEKKEGIKALVSRVSSWSNVEENQLIQ